MRQMVLGDTQQRAPGLGLEPGGHCSEDSASVHGTPALPTELIGAPITLFNKKS